MYMNREQWSEWAKSLKLGDKVIVKGFGNLYVDTVKKVTPKGWVVTENFGTYAQTQWNGSYSERGGYKYIEPFTEELGKKAEEEMQKREREQKIKRTIRAAKNVAYDWRYGKSDIDYDLALKILELAGVEVK